MSSRRGRRLGPELSLTGAVERAYSAGVRGRDGRHVAQHQLSICTQKHFNGEPDTRAKKGDREELLSRTR